MLVRRAVLVRRVATLFFCRLRCVWVVRVLRWCVRSVIVSNLVGSILQFLRPRRRSEGCSMETMGMETVKYVLTEPIVSDFSR